MKIDFRESALFPVEIAKNFFYILLFFKNSLSKRLYTG